MKKKYSVLLSLTLIVTLFLGPVSTTPSKACLTDPVCEIAAGIAVGAGLLAVATCADPLTEWECPEAITEWTVALADEAEACAPPCE